MAIRCGGVPLRKQVNMKDPRHTVGSEPAHGGVCERIWYVRRYHCIGSITKISGIADGIEKLALMFNQILQD
jgi:hypothetical protein